MTRRTGMDSITAGQINVVVFRTVIINSAEHIGVEYRDIVFRADFHYGSAVFTEGASVNILFVLIPVIAAAYGTVHGTLRHGNENELSIFELIHLFEFRNLFAPCS